MGMKKVATFIKDMTPEFLGEARLYRVDPPLKVDPWDDESSETTEYVISSASSVLGAPETYIFAADSEGKVTNWGELNGSEKGFLDCDRAIRGAGYDLQEAN